MFGRRLSMMDRHLGLARAAPAIRQSFKGESFMLVLSRKPSQSIVINDDITITIVEIRGDKCRVGIEAPKDVSVHRREVWLAIKAGTPVKPAAPAA
jgi:carbon storage regulator